jgi:hypothetical protein
MTTSASEIVSNSLYSLGFCRVQLRDTSRGFDVRAANGSDYAPAVGSRSAPLR